MVEIFLMARDDTAYHPHDFRHPRRIGSSHWVPLMRVCRHWWAVAWSTPQFWRIIDVYRNLEWLSLYLARAAEVTIEVSLQDESTALAAIPILLGVADRLSTLLLPEIDENRFHRSSRSYSSFIIGSRALKTLVWLGCTAWTWSISTWEMHD